MKREFALKTIRVQYFLGLTLIQRQREKGNVRMMRSTDKAVSTNAVNPGPSGSSEKEKKKSHESMIFEL